MIVTQCFLLAIDGISSGSCNIDSRLDMALIDVSIFNVETDSRLDMTLIDF